MIFFDASAAAKRYFQEIGSERVQDLWSRPDIRSSLAILHCELASALNRKLRERGLSRGVYESVKDQIEADLAKLNTVPADDNLIERSLRLLDAHPLRALDSLYLAAALSLQQTSKIPVLFVSADRQLLRAAQAEGLKVLDPERAV
jgi:predicted nucleic acid-binding protein